MRKTELPRNKQRRSAGKAWKTERDLAASIAEYLDQRFRARRKVRAA